MVNAVSIKYQSSVNQVSIKHQSSINQVSTTDNICHTKHQRATINLLYNWKDSLQQIWIKCTYKTCGISVEINHSVPG